MVGRTIPRALQRAAFFLAIAGLVCVISFGIYTPFNTYNKEDKREREERGEWKECKPMPVSGMVIRTAFLLLFAALISVSLV